MESDFITWEKWGVKCCNKIPDGYKNASINDLFINGMPIIDKWYILKSFHEDETYEAYKTSSYTSLSNLKPWFDAGTIYVR